LIPCIRFGTEGVGKREHSFSELWALPRCQRSLQANREHQLV